MSVGMKVMCSIMEGHVRGGLQSSPCRALNGNQLIPTITYLQSQIWKINTAIGGPGRTAGIGFSTFQDDGLGVPFATPTDVWNCAFAYWDTQTYTYDDTPFQPPGTATHTFTGICSVSNNCPVNTGFPSGIFQTSPATPWGTPGTLWASPLINPPFPVNFSQTELDYQIAGLLPYLLTIVYSNPSDFSATTLQLVTDVQAQTFTWAGGAFSKIYDESGVVADSGDISSLNPSSYTLALKNGSRSGALLPSAAFGCAGGWRMLGSDPATLVAGVGLTKNETGSPQNYFIARMRERFQAGFSGSVPIVVNPTNASLPAYILTIVSMGTIGINNYIGNSVPNVPGGDVVLPFPVDNPLPVNVDGNTVIVADFYFVIIGQDPVGWAAASGGFVFSNLQTADSATLTADSNYTV